MFKGNSLNLSTFLTPAALSLVLAEFLGFEGLLGRMEH